MFSSTSHAGDDFDKSVHTFTYSGDSSDYLSDSDNDLLPETEARHWRGIDRSTDERCAHGRPRRKVCWGGRNTGRRFLGYRLEEDGKQCSYVKWIDPEWLERVQVSFNKLWHQSKQFMRARRHCSNDLRDALAAKVNMEQRLKESEEAMERRMKQMVDELKKWIILAKLSQARWLSSEGEKKRVWMLVGILVCVMMLYLIIHKN
ncbi:hypothetical protein EJB05_00001 [Eragrostis curvula]|uniref:Zinc finger GRF-type domain-containing protein n=1 Tax=Eragrostis curvula TaxID=38414 RepID=A0A5J9WVZ0_9POAL|nr:hypothetical protein EJB05_00001 [Eragrostis curvula]